MQRDEAPPIARSGGARRVQGARARWRTGAYRRLLERAAGILIDRILVGLAVRVGHLDLADEQHPVTDGEAALFIDQVAMRIVEKGLKPIERGTDIVGHRHLRKRGAAGRRRIVRRGRSEVERALGALRHGARSAPGEAVGLAESRSSGARGFRGIAIRKSGSRAIGRMRDGLPCAVMGTASLDMDPAIIMPGIPFLPDREAGACARFGWGRSILRSVWSVAATAA